MIDKSIIVADNLLSSRIQKRVRQILPEIAKEVGVKGSPGYYKNCDWATLAMECKKVAIEYNCYILSWVTPDEGCCEAYNAGTRDEENADSYLLGSAETEYEAVFLGFLWLADRQNFIPQARSLYLKIGD